MVPLMTRRWCDCAATMPLSIKRSKCVESLGRSVDTGLTVRCSCDSKNQLSMCDECAAVRRKVPIFMALHQYVNG